MIIVGTLIACAPFRPVPVEMPPVQAVVAGYGQAATPTPSRPLGSALQFDTPRLPRHPRLFSGVEPPAAATTSGTITRAPVTSPAPWELPPCPAVVSGYGLPAVVEVPSEPVVLRAPRLTPVRLPPRGGVFAGLTVVSAPVSLLPTQAVTPPPFARRPPVPLIATGVAPDVPVPLRPMQAEQRPPFARRPPASFVAAGVTLEVPIPLCPVQGTTSAPFASLPPKASIVVGFGEAEPPDPTFVLAGPGRTSHSRRRLRTSRR